MATNSLPTRPTNEAAPPAGVPRIHLEQWQHWMLFAIVLVFLYEARTVLGPFIIAGIIAYVFAGAVTTVQERLRWPRVLVAALLYLLVLGLIGGLLYFGARAVINETIDLSNKGPSLVESAITQLLGSGPIDVFGQHFDAHRLAQQADQGLKDFLGRPGDAVHYGVVVIERLLDTFLVIVVSFYLIVQGHKLGPYLLKFLPATTRPTAGYIAGRIHTLLGAYIRGQLLLIALMSVVTWLALHFIFGLHYAVPIAIATGVLEVLPYLGPVIAAMLAAGVALAQGGPGMALGILVLYIILRQAEDQLVMPFVVGHAVDLPPVATIFAVLAGGAIGGVLGILTAVPVAAAIKLILDFLYPARPEHTIAQARPGLEQAAREAEEQDA